eukprot:g3563.t1
MKADRCVPNSITYNLLINIFQMLGDNVKKMEILEESRNVTGLKPGVALYNSLLRHQGKYSKQNPENNRIHIDNVSQLYHEMVQNDILPNQLTYTTFIKFYYPYQLHSQYYDEVDQIIKDMEVRGLKLDLESHISMLKTCLRVEQNSETALNEAEKIFSKITDDGFQPTHEVYMQLIFAFARNNRIDDMSVYLGDLIREGFLANASKNTINYFYNKLLRNLCVGRVEKDTILRYATEAYSHGCNLLFHVCVRRILIQYLKRGDFDLVHFLLQKHVEHTAPKYLQAMYEDKKLKRYFSFQRMTDGSINIPAVTGDDSNANIDGEDYKKLAKYIAELNKGGKYRKLGQRQKKLKERKSTGSKVVRKRETYDHLTNYEINMKEVDEEKIQNDIKELAAERRMLETEKALLKEKEELFNQRQKIFNEREAIVELERELLTKESKMFEHSKLECEGERNEEITTEETVVDVVLGRGGN